MRLFVAAPLPIDIRQRLAPLGAGLPGARWVEADNMHITLRFIGEVDVHQAEDVDAVLAAIRGSAFDLRLSGIGHFDTGRKVHTLWVGVETSDALVHLQKKVESAVVRSGLEAERRKFHAHVTLARLRSTPNRRIGAYVEAHNGFAAGPIRVDRFALVESLRGGGQVHYRELADYPLRD